jgi:hypothetical protein
MGSFNVLNDSLIFFQDKPNTIITNDLWFSQRIFIFSFLLCKFNIIGGPGSSYLENILYTKEEIKFIKRFDRKLVSNNNYPFNDEGYLCYKFINSKNTIVQCG